MSPAMKTAALAGLAATAAAFAPMAPAALPAVSAHRCPKDRAASGLRMGFFDFAQSKGDGLTFKEWTHKEALKGPKGAGLGGDIEVLFKIGDEEKPTNAFAGQPLSEVAAQVRCHRPLAPPRRDAGRRLRGAVDTTIVLRAGGRRDPVQVQKGRVRDVQGNDRWTLDASVPDQDPSPWQGRSFPSQHPRGGFR